MRLAIHVFGFAASALLAVPALTACGGDDGNAEQLSDEEWVAGFCEATEQLGEEMERVGKEYGAQAVTPEFLEAMAPLYRQYAQDLADLGGPEGLEAFFDDYVEASYRTADTLAEGDVTVDAFRPLEEIETPPGMAERFGPIALKDPVCQRANITFDYVEPAESVTPGPTPAEGTFKPPVLDYNNPAKFREPGRQSTLSPASIEALRREVMPAPGTGAARIYRWIATTFRTQPSGGATIGRVDVNDLIASRVLGGCHDSALVMTAALRYFGYPAVMVDTAGLQWAADYRAGKTQTFAGHVFAEVLTNDGWMLVDCSGGMYAMDYDPRNPAINYRGAGDATGFFALYKGTDPASYGVTSNAVLQERMAEFADALPQLEVDLPDYEWTRFE